MISVTTLCCVLTVLIAFGHRGATAPPRRPGGAETSVDDRFATRVSRAPTRLPRWPRRGCIPDDDMVARQSLEFLARSMRAGRTLRGALEDLVDRRGSEPMLRSWLTPVTGAMNNGATVRQALLASATATPLSGGHRLWHRALVLASRPGLHATRVLDQAALAAADRVEDRRERRAHAAQAVLSARVLVAVPAVTAGLAALVDPEVRHVLVATPLGGVCLGGGLGLAWAGRIWMRHIVDDEPRRR